MEAAAKVYLILAVIFAPGSWVETPVAGKLEVKGSYASCKQVENGLRERFRAEGVKIEKLECERQEAGR